MFRRCVRAWNRLEWSRKNNSGYLSVRGHTLSVGGLCAMATSLFFHPRIMARRLSRSPRVYIKAQEPMSHSTNASFQSFSNIFFPARVLATSNFFSVPPHPIPLTPPPPLISPLPIPPSLSPSLASLSNPTPAPRSSTAEPKSPLAFKGEIEAKCVFVRIRKIGGRWLAVHGPVFLEGGRTVRL